MRIQNHCEKNLYVITDLIGLMKFVWKCADFTLIWEANGGAQEVARDLVNRVLLKAVLIT